MISLNIPKNLVRWGLPSCYSHFVVEETEAHRG